MTIVYTSCSCYCNYYNNRYGRQGYYHSRGGQMGAKEPIVAPPGFLVALGQFISYTKLDLSLPSGIQISDT